MYSFFTIFSKRSKKSTKMKCFFTFWPPVEAYLNLMFIPNFSWLANWHLLWKDPILCFVFTKKSYFLIFFFPFSDVFLDFLEHFGGAFGGSETQNPGFRGQYFAFLGCRSEFITRLSNLWPDLLLADWNLSNVSIHNSQLKKEKICKKKGKMYCK